MEMAYLGNRWRGPLAVCLALVTCSFAAPFFDIEAEGPFHLAAGVFSAQNDGGSGVDAGNTTATAVNLTGVGTYVGYVNDVSDDTDAYAFNLSNGKGVHISLSMPNGADFDLYLWNGNVSLVDYSLTGNPETVSSNGTNITAGIIYISISAYNGSGNYTFTITTFTTGSTGSGQNDAGSGRDAGNTTATAVNLTGAGTYTGYVHDTNDITDAFALNLSTGTGVYASVTMPALADFDLYLYNSIPSVVNTSAGVVSPEVVSSNGTNITSGMVYIVVESFSGAGTYTLMVSTFSTNSSGGSGNSSGNNTGGNTTVGQNDAGSGRDAGNSSTTAVNLTSVGVYTGYVHDTTDVADAYAFNLSTGLGVYATLAMPSGDDFDLFLWNGNQSMVNYSLTYSPEAVSSNGTNITAGIIYITVEAYAGAGNYTLTITTFSATSSGGGGSTGTGQNDAGSGRDAGNTTATAVNLTGPGTYKGYVHDTNDITDAFALNLSSGTGVYASLAMPALTDYDLLLYNNVPSVVNTSAGVVSPEVVSSNGTNITNGMVYIVVESFSGAGAYTLVISTFSTNSSGGSGNSSGNNTSGNTTTGQNDAGSGRDAGNSTTTAVNLTAAGAYIGYVHDANDILDAYAFNLSSGLGIYATLTMPTGSDFDLLLWNGNQSLVNYSLLYNPESVSSNGTNITAGMIYITVEAYIGSGNYTLTITTFPTSGGGGQTGPSGQNDAGSGRDAGNSTTTAVNLTAARAYTGYVHDTNDWIDVYSFLLPNTTGLYATLTMPTGNDYDLFLWNGNQSLVNYSLLYNPEVVSSNGTNITAGIVYITIESYIGSGNYTLTISTFSTAPPPPPPDADGDGIPDAQDAFPNDPNEWDDSDGDGVGDNSDAFPNDAAETADSDADGVGDNADAFPNDAAETKDTDGDGVGDNADAFPEDGTETSDLDGDRVGDNTDVFPNDPAEWEDTDGDGVGDNADAFPNDASETTDSDDDGIGDNADLDDDGDSWSDEDEGICGTDSMDQSSVPDDLDGDGVCDSEDGDDDGDSWSDVAEGECSTDPGDEDSTPIDTDGDGECNVIDADDDGDGHLDSKEITCYSNPLDRDDVPIDTDEDGECNAIDDDDDGDGVLDLEDAAPLDPAIGKGEVNLRMICRDEKTVAIHADEPLPSDSVEGACPITQSNDQIDWNVTDKDGDEDMDGLTNQGEVDHGTDMNHPDSDRDGLMDGFEVEHGLNPLNPDTDGDGMVDSIDKTPNGESPDSDPDDSDVSDIDGDTGPLDGDGEENKTSTNTSQTNLSDAINPADDDSSSEASQRSAAAGVNGGGGIALGATVIIPIIIAVIGVVLLLMRKQSGEDEEGGSIMSGYQINDSGQWVVEWTELPPGGQYVNNDDGNQWYMHESEGSWLRLDDGRFQRR